MSDRAICAAAIHDADWWRPLPEPREPLLEAAAATPAPGGTLAFGALMAFTAILLLAPQKMVPALAAIRVALLAAAVAALAHAGRCFVVGRPLVRLSPAMIFTALLVAWAIITTPLSIWPGGSIDLLTGLYLKSVMVFVLLAGAVDTPARLRRAFVVLLWLAVPLSIAALSHFATGTYAEVGSQRIAGYDAPLTDNPNDLALMLNLIIPLGIALWSSAAGTAKRAALLALVGLHMAAVIVTFSRGGFLTLATIMLFFGAKLLRRGAWRAVVIGFVLVLLFLLLLPAGYNDRLATILDVDSDPTGSAQDRSRDIALAARWVVEHPLIGAGADMSMLVLNDLRGPDWKDVHNVYLQYGVDLGGPGLALFACLLVAAIASARGASRRAAARTGGREMSMLAEGLEVSLVAFAVAAFFHPVGYQFYFFYMAGLAEAARGIVPAAEAAS